MPMQSHSSERAMPFIFAFFLVTSCLVVATQSCLEVNPIKKMNRTKNKVTVKKIQLMVNRSVLLEILLITSFQEFEEEDSCGLLAITHNTFNYYELKNSQIQKLKKQSACKSLKTTLFTGE